MGIDRSEATRIARLCLPKLIANAYASDGNDEEVGGSIDFDVDSLSNQNVTSQSLCRLWAGMGHIYQLTIEVPSNQATKHSIIVKRVVPPSKKSRSMGDERKAASYLIEANFYESLAPQLISEHGLSIPTPYHVERDASTDRVTICMSRLHGSPSYLGDDGSVHAVLSWLATLHSATWGAAVDDYVERGIVQPIGSYWHLDTRPDEHDSMPRRGWEGRLKLAARAIDERLKRDEMQCCIHGDAKDANMLFHTKDGGEVGVSMYDFQYCGKAPPSVDLAYFLCVAVGDTDSAYIEYYHEQLVPKLKRQQKQQYNGANVYIPTLHEIEESVALALCDFQRFMSGWGQWGSDISDSVIRVLDRLDGGTKLKSEDAYREAMLREFG
eukprot:CAMPEP_0183707390 /NCGR_PEP_ID=MMETSP0737-20130205/3976_1 /TAXON_ID=385413 /ORGANISM="Thalassiosira miniscula, Strain CCMP1093" /LENGTH=381 /DNA_ID=CAMNT_0025935039 /DNA_START=34 /DNA_END=1179 /DNA_ORIENTATION=+